MSAYILIVGLVLANQVGAADGRYKNFGGGQAGATAPPAGDSTNRGMGGSPDAEKSTLFGNGGAAAGAGGDVGGSVGPNSGAPNPLRNSAASNQTQPQLLDLQGNRTQPITDTAGSRSTPAAYETPANPANGAASPGTSAMMRAMLSPQPGSQLPGKSVPLVEVIDGARSRGEQTQRVEAYWDLCSSVADYYLGLRELEELKRYVQRGGQWDRFELEMRNRTVTAQRAALASQLRLSSLMGRGNDFLPLPADALHCASYNTRYEEIFPRGGSAEAKELAALLPLRYGELKGAAALVSDSEQYLNQFATSRSTDIEGGLHALDLLALRRRAFVQIARDYNRRIARYAELASPGPLTPDRLTGILIKSSVATATKSGAAAPPANRQSKSGSLPQWTTFVEGSNPPMSSASGGAKREDAVQRASATETTPKESTSRRSDGERSLLVNPQGQ